ncbi:MAG: exosortase/archaeosortase family protein [Thermoplasmatota archaeon]|nr:archaeosortase/exosortase family protein [Halobacteriales archaeon]
MRIPLGLMLAGYGTLVLVGVMPHESPAAGAVALTAGLALLFLALRRPAALPAATAGRLRARLLALLGGAIATGVVAYNVVRRSNLGPPEMALAAYGAILVAAAPYLDRRCGAVRVATLVGWSFPLLLAPLSLFALNAAVSSGAGATALGPFVGFAVVQPTAAGLRLLGTPTHVVGSTMLVPTARGTLSLGVGLVCAGLYPIVLFAGIVMHHAWSERLAPRRAMTLVAAGVAGLWVLNLVRLVALARVGVAWGPATLQTVHANLGWVLFALYMAAFWAVALRPRPARA